MEKHCERRIAVTINKDALLPYLIYNQPYVYSEKITLYPVTMKDIVLFQAVSPSITVRKNSTFRDKKIIKMPYLDFLLYSFSNEALEEASGIPNLSNYYGYALQLLQLCCRDGEVKLNHQTGQIAIGEEIITPQIFDDLRRIIILQNDMDFDIDEFLNYDTEQRLLKAQKASQKNDRTANIEDYIDSLVIAMNITEESVMKMTIRKFYRYIRRYQLYENYRIAKTGECSGMVSFKEPIQHWMTSLDEEDRYQDVKADENTIKGKINDANT